MYARIQGNMGHVTLGKLRKLSRSLTRLLLSYPIQTPERLRVNDAKD
jgi:hypothetical protein